jgi:hypothetical protein
MARGFHGTPKLTAEPTVIIFKVPPYFGIEVLGLAAAELAAAGMLGPEVVTGAGDDAVATGTGGAVVLAGAMAGVAGAGAGVDEELHPIIMSEQSKRIVNGRINLCIFCLL